MKVALFAGQAWPVVAGMTAAEFAADPYMTDLFYTEAVKLMDEERQKHQRRQSSSKQRRR